MSTRCNVVVRHAKNRIYLYRHYDGYPAETGASIVEALRKAIGTPAAHPSEHARLDIFMGALFANRYDATSYSPARPMYEFTNDLHGDIEYVYEVDFDRDLDRFIRVAERSPEWHIDSGKGFAADRWTDGGAWCSLDGLTARVNRDREDINRRIAELRAKHPQQYADTSDYPMLERAAA